MEALDIMSSWCYYVQSLRSCSTIIHTLNSPVELRIARGYPSKDGFGGRWVSRYLLPQTCPQASLGGFGRITEVL